MRELDPAQLQRWMDTAVRAAEAGAEQLRRFHGQLSDTQVRRKAAAATW